MTYTYSISPHDGEISLVLDEYCLIIKKGTKEEIISYANVTSVRMSKSSGHVFQTHLSADGHGTLVICSHSINGNGAWIEQSVAYGLFVRVLHHHLKDKSHSVFTLGGDIDRIWKWATFSGVFSFGISLATNYFGFTLMNPYVQGLIFAVLVTAMMVIINLKKMPKSYHPTDIPLHFLP